MAVQDQNTEAQPTPNQPPPQAWPLWSTRPQDGPLTWHIQVPASVRKDLVAGGDQPGAFKAHHLPALVALHALVPRDGQATFGPDAQDQLVIRPAVLAAAAGVAPDTLRAWLTNTGPLTPYAQYERTFWLPDDGCDADPADDGQRWVLHVNPPEEGAWLKVPAWWLFARTYATLQNGRTVERRLLRGLRRKSGVWVPGPPVTPGALVGALMVIERSNFSTTPPRTYSYSVPTLAKRWGISEPTANRYLRAAEDAGYLAPERRTGGNGRAAIRTVVMIPDQAPGTPLPPTWGHSKRSPSEQEQGM